MSDSDDLAVQVAALKKQLRFTQALLFCLLVACCLAAKSQAEREVRAEKFVVVDQAGRTVGELSAGPHGGTLDLSTYHKKTVQSGFHAEAGELRIRDVAHEDDMLFVGLLGTRCYGQLTVSPPSSAEVTGPSGLLLDANRASPRLKLTSGSNSYEVLTTPERTEISPVDNKMPATEGMEPES